MLQTRIQLNTSLPVIPGAQLTTLARPLWLGGAILVSGNAVGGAWPIKTPGHHPLAFPLFRELQGPVAKPVAFHLEEPESLNGCMEKSTCCLCKPPGQQQEEWYTWTVPGLKLQYLLTALEFKCVR